MNVHDFDGLTTKFKQLNEEGINRVLRNIAEAVGETLLNNIIEEITRQDLIDTGTMRNSFARGDKENVWEWDVDRNAITLEVGSNLGTDPNDPNKWGYPRLINEGYTIKSKKKIGFQATPRTFIGRHYFDIAVKELEGGINELILERLEIELRRVFS
ncbi:HK97 gp10 family phage protein [Paenibacillus alvei]|uniref:HK97 gp10 family phage protein n=1 Tax=Paenibacillus alvei TaxID=44250 RepID=A0AAP7A3K9_PAEAL|nr:HK97 gp10 family phage protein [Paenibacillus alvei]